MRFIIFLILFLTGCCPMLSGPPGDAGAVNWQPKERQFPSEIIDCQGKERGSLLIRKSGTVVLNCVIRGSIRIYGPARNGEGPTLKKRSRKGDYVDWIRSESPTRVTIKDSKIIATGSIPLYIAPGVTFTTIRNVEITGTSTSVAIYLDAESSRTTIDNVIVNVRTGREAIAIDATDRNEIRNSDIYGPIYLYRNCGKDGNSRHTTPSYNHIHDNSFFVQKGSTAIYLGSRGKNDRKCYCLQDSDSNFGSGKSDEDHARQNLVERNYLRGGLIIVGSGEGNIIRDNFE